MDELKQRFAAWFIQTFAARAVVKVLSAAAVGLAAHGLMKTSSENAWVNSNAEIILGGIGWAATWLLTRKQHTASAAATHAAVVQALATPVPARPDAGTLAAQARAIIEGKTPNGLP